MRSARASPAFTAVEPRAEEGAPVRRIRHAVGRQARGAEAASNAGASVLEEFMAGTADDLPRSEYGRQTDGLSDPTSACSIDVCTARA
jgi:hypothetical protein